MYPRFVSLLAVIPLSTLASAYTLQDHWQGWDFTSWSYFTGSDPTGGNVNYQDLQNAENLGLIYVDGNGAFNMQVDSWSSVPAGGNRNSVRITSTTSYSSGLFILDATAMPGACGVWPAFWTNGPNWPMAGEIDIVEGVNNQANNQITLHSGTNTCDIDMNDQSAFTGQVLGANPVCYSTQSSDAGCGISVNTPNSFGSGFTNNGGGVYAMLWDPTSGISIYFFERNNIPADITNQTPTPANWGKPAGFWSATTCNIGADFYDHSIIFDITVCGGWAGAAYTSSGCPGTCSDIVADASNFVGAKWTVNYLSVYSL